jgi:hypothetical protein
MIHSRLVCEQYPSQGRHGSLHIQCTFKCSCSRLPVICSIGHGTVLLETPPIKFKNRHQSTFPNQVDPDYYCPKWQLLGTSGILLHPVCDPNHYITSVMKPEPVTCMASTLSNWSSGQIYYRRGWGHVAPLSNYFEDPIVGSF